MAAMHTPPIRGHLSQLLSSVKSLGALQHARFVDLLTMEDQARLKNTSAAYLAAAADSTQWLPGPTTSQPTGENAVDSSTNDSGSHHSFYAQMGGTRPLSSPPGHQRASKRQIMGWPGAEGMDTGEMSIDPIQPTQPGANSFANSSQFSHPQEQVIINPRAQAPQAPQQPPAAYSTLPNDVSLGHRPPTADQTMWHPINSVNMMYGVHLGPNQGPGWVYSPFQPHVLASQGYLNPVPTHSPMVPPAQPSLQNTTPTPLPQQASYQVPYQLQTPAPFQSSAPQFPTSQQPLCAQPAQLGPPHHAGTSIASGTSADNQSSIFTDAPSGSASYTHSHPGSSFDPPRPPAGPSVEPSVGPSADLAGGSSMSVLDFSQEIPDEQGDRYRRLWSPGEKNVIILHWVGLRAHTDHVHIALNTPRNVKASQVDKAWTDFAAGPFKGTRDVATIVSQWWLLVDVYCVLLASEATRGFDPLQAHQAPGFLERVWQQLTEALNTGKVLSPKNPVKEQDLAPWFETYRWFAVMERIAFHPVITSRVTVFRCETLPSQPTNLLRGRRPKSNKSDKVLNRAGLRLVATPPPPPSVEDSVAGSVQQPSVPTQSSWREEELAADGVARSISIALPSNLPGMAEMVRSQRIASDADIELSHAKAVYFAAEAESTQLGSLERIANMDLAARAYQRDTAMQLFSHPMSNNQDRDNARACLKNQFAPELSTVDLADLLRRHEDVKGVINALSPERKEAMRVREEASRAQEGSSSQEGGSLPQEAPTAQETSLAQEAADASTSAHPPM